MSTESSKDASCIIAAPIVGEGRDADQPTPSCRIAKRESCFGPITGRLHSRWCSSSRLVAGKTPSQPLHDTSGSRWSSSPPLARRRMILGPSRISTESLGHLTEMNTIKCSTVKRMSPDLSWSKSKLVVSDSSRFICFCERLRPVIAHALTA